MIFVGALLMIVAFGVGGAELVRVQCRRMLAQPVRPRQRHVRTRRLARGSIRPPARTAPMPASPRTV
jgi:hypothetical protein